jgi:dienelactone hydrolase
MDVMTPMPGYEAFQFSEGGNEKTVFTRGSGPGILLMHELPGMVEECVRLGDYLASRGYAVFLPLLFGKPNVRESRLRTAAHIGEICVRREILLLAADSDSPITTWLRALAREVRRRCPEGRGIGAIGMCLTGGFVVNLMLEDAVLAPVACQPSLPFTKLGAPREAVGVSPDTLRAAVARSKEVPLLCYRFSGDKISRREIFARLEREFGTAFEGHELPGDDHAVLTIDFVDNPSHPTYKARERILRFFAERLGVAAAV